MPIAKDTAIAAVWRPPFSSQKPTIVSVVPGATLAEIVRLVPGLPDGFEEIGSVAINGEIIPPQNWRRVRPKPGTMRNPVTVTLQITPLGGGGGGGGGGNKGLQIAAIVATVALAFVTFGISNGLILASTSAAIGGALGIGATAGAALLAATVGIAGSLAISALTSPPTRKAQSDLSPDRVEKGPASAQGNVLEPGAPIPRVIGTRRVFPAMGMHPIVDIVGDDEIAEALFVLAGPHKIEEPRIGNGAIQNEDNLETQFREGWDDDQPLDMLFRYGRMDVPQVEMSAHDVQDRAQDTLERQDLPNRSLPTWHGVASRQICDEIWLHLSLPEGLSDSAATTARQRIPFRVRLKRRGTTTWINCPELHLEAKEPGGLRKAIKFKWGARPQLATVPDTGWVAAYKTVSPSALIPYTGGWVANSHFSAGAGNDGLYVDVISSSNVANTVLEYEQATFYLDPAVHLPGVYDIEIMRGCSFASASFTPSSYTYGGQRHDFFGYNTATGSVARIARSRQGIQERAYLNRIVSVVNKHPMPGRGMAAMAIKAKNRSIDQFSVLASGYTRDWDGQGWNTWKTTSNPAPHFVDVMTGVHNPDPLPAEMVHNSSLVDWRQRCMNDGLECNAILEGAPIADVLRMISGCGYARNTASEVWGVFQDYDRSEEPPVSVFTPRNISGFKIEKAFTRLPDAFRVIYRDIDANYEEVERIVYRPGRESGRFFERVTYEGVVYEDQALERARFDLLQAEKRSATYSWKSHAEALVCRRGDLVQITHDIIDRHAGAARIEAVAKNEYGQIVEIVLDSAVPVVNEVDWFATTAFFAVENVFDLGRTTSAVIRVSAGEVLAPLSVAGQTGETDILTMSAPFYADEITEGQLVVVGPASQIGRRVIITDMRWNNDLTVDITAVDEAPELWT